MFLKWSCSLLRNDSIGLLSISYSRRRSLSFSMRLKRAVLTLARGEKVAALFSNPICPLVFPTFTLNELIPVWALKLFVSRLLDAVYCVCGLCSAKHRSNPRLGCILMSTYGSAPGKDEATMSCTEMFKLRETTGTWTKREFLMLDLTADLRVCLLRLSSIMSI